MNADDTRKAAHRHSLLSIIMFGLLVVSVLAAWAVTLTRGRVARRGGEILQTLRKQTADAYWADQRTHWTITRQGDAPKRWSFYSRRLDTDGRYSGVEMTVEYVKGGARGLWSTWRLNPDLSGAVYNAGRLIVAGGGFNMPTDTTTIFENDILYLTQRGPKREINSQAAAGDNYIPEGAMPLVRLLVAREQTEALLVAREQTEAQFERILDYKPSVDGIIQFPRLMMEYQGTADAYDGAPKVMVRLPGSAAAEQGQLYVLDKEGLPLATFTGKMKETATTQQEVFETFEGSEAILRAALQRLGVRWGS
jgi:hypothetical protein